MLIYSLKLHIFNTLQFDKKIFFIKFNTNTTNCNILPTKCFFLNLPTIFFTDLHNVEVNPFFLEKWHLPPTLALTNVHHVEVVGRILHIVCVCVCMYVCVRARVCVTAEIRTPQLVIFAVFKWLQTLSAVCVCVRAIERCINMQERLQAVINQRGGNTQF